MNESTTPAAPANQSQPAEPPKEQLLSLEDDTPLAAPSCSLDGGPCEACQ